MASHGGIKYFHTATRLLRVGGFVFHVSTAEKLNDRDHKRPLPLSTTL